MSPGALHLIGERSGGAASLSPPAGDRSSLGAQLSAAPGPGSGTMGAARPLGMLLLLLAQGLLCAAATRECFPCRASLPRSAPCALPAREKRLLPAPALGGCWSPARRPGGDSRSHRRVAWPGIREMPELGKCAENCSVIFSLCSTGTWSWLELKLGSWQQVLSNASPAQAWLKRQMQNGLCTVGLAQLCLGEARSETMLPTGTLGPVDPKPQGAQPRN